MLARKFNLVENITKKSTPKNDVLVTAYLLVNLPDYGLRYRYEMTPMRPNNRQKIL